MKEKITFIIGSVVIYLFLTIGIIVGIMSYDVDKSKMDAINGGVIVQAEYISVGHEYPLRHSKPYYYLFYKYIDENGVKYSGRYGFFKTEEEAQPFVGKTIEIYIDGKGTCVPVSEASSFKPNSMYIITGICGGAMLLYTACIIVIPLLKRKYPNSWLNHGS